MKRFFTFIVKMIREAILRIRDILRGPGVSITGMDSMRHICLYLLARFMTKERSLRMGVPEQFSWEQMMDVMLNQSGGTQFAFDMFCNPRTDCLINHIDRLFDTNTFTFDVKSPQKHQEIMEILNKVNIFELDSEIDLLGWIYEQHLKTGSGAARDLGQFFTDRAVCRYMVSLCEPGYKGDGVPERVCDPSMGTGGFLTAYMKYYGDTVDWNLHEDKICGCDADPKVSALARLNFFMETGGIRSQNLITRDSLYNDVPHEGYDVILANMPFGLKGIKHADCCERVKNLKIRGTKSEPLFLQLMMETLNMGGRAAVIVPDGILINQSAIHALTRQHLLDNFELHAVIKMKGQLFMNTSIQPSILFFERTGQPTKSIEFWEISKNQEQEIEDTLLLTIQRNELDENLNLDIRKYLPASSFDNIQADLEYPVHTFSSILYTPKAAEVITLSNAIPGEYPLYSAAMDVKSHHQPGYVTGGPWIVQACVGSNLANCVHYIETPFAVTGNLWVLAIQDDFRESISLKYVYYWLLLSKEIMKKVNVSVIPKVNKGEFMKLEIPVPDRTIQDKIVTMLDENADMVRELSMHTNRGMELLLRYPDGVKFQHVLDSLRTFQMNKEMEKRFLQEMENVIQSLECRRYEKVSLEEVCEYENGRPLSSQIGEYPIMGGGTQYNGYTDSFNRDGETITISKSGTAGYVAFHNGKFWAGDCFSVKPLEEEEDRILLKYLYYYLKFNSARIIERVTGTAILHCKWADINDIMIILPPIDVQQQIINRLNQLQRQVDTVQQNQDNIPFLIESYLN